MEYDSDKMLEESLEGAYDDMMDGSGSKRSPGVPGRNSSSSRRRTTSSRTPGSNTPGTGTSRYSSSTSRTGTSGYSRSRSTSARGAALYGGYSEYGRSSSGKYDVYGAPERASTTKAAVGRPQTTLLVQLSVELIEEAPVSAAKEFMEVLVVCLEDALEKAHGRHYEHIMNRVLRWAEVELELAQSELGKAMGVSPPDSQTHQQLEHETVDLSEIKPELLFNEAIEIIKESIDPPLQIVVMWRDLYDNAEVEQTTPVDMDGLYSVRLGTGLKLLLRSVHEKLGYEVRDDIITIATKGSLPSLDKTAGVEGVPENRVRALYEEKTNLARDKQRMEMDMVAMEARFKAIHEHISKLEHEATEEVKDDRVLSELEQIVKMSQDQLMVMERLVEKGTASMAELMDMREKLTRAKVELAKHKDQLSQSAGGSRIANYNDELASMSIDMAEKKAYMQTLDKRLAEVERELAAASIAGAESERIRFARQQMEVAERRVAEVKGMAGSIQEPSVIVIGAD